MAPFRLVLSTPGQLHRRVMTTTTSMTNAFIASNSLTTNDQYGKRVCGYYRFSSTNMNSALKAPVANAFISSFGS